MTNLHGQVIAALSLPELAATVGMEARIRESSHYQGGQYLRCAGSAAELSFERVADREYLVRGDGDSLSELRALAWAVSSHLTIARIKHRLEIYGNDRDRLHAYFHWEWPLASAWIGCLSPDGGLAESVAAILRAVGVKTAVKVFERFPIADPLASLVAALDGSYSTVVWLVRNDDGREVWVKKESEVLRARTEDRIAVHIYTVVDGAVQRPTGETLCQANDVGAGLAIAQDAFSNVDSACRRLLVVKDTFLITDRGLILTPEVPLELLPGAWSQHIDVEVRVPQRLASVFAAHAAIPFIDPPRPDRKPAYILTLPDATKEVVPIDSEIWLIGARAGTAT